MSISKVTEALAACETSLREILKRAAAAGDYDEVAQVADLARRVAALIPSDGKRFPVEDTNVAAVPDREPRRKPRKGDYPRFLRRGDSLVKVAWSKADRKEYQHRAPSSVLAALLQALAAQAKGGRVFPLDRVMPIRTTEGEVPSYQVYVWLAWLREAGLLEQRGRQGYAVPRSLNLVDAATALWQRTSEE